MEGCAQGAHFLSRRNPDNVPLQGDIVGTVPNLGDLTTDEYSFVIKCPASRHLPVRRKNSSALQGRWLEEPEGFPTHVSFRKGNKRTLWPPHGEQKERYAPVGVRPPPPLRGSSPCKAGQFIPAGFDCRHSEVCKSRDSVSLNSLNSFFQMVLNPQECGLFHIVITADFGPFAEFQDFYSSYSHKISAAP